MSDNARLADSKVSEKEVKRKQIFLHQEAPFMNPRLTRKLSYTDAHYQRQTERARKPMEKRPSNGFGSQSRKQFNTNLIQSSNTEILNTSQCKGCNCGAITSNKKCTCISRKGAMYTNLKPTKVDNFMKAAIQKKKTELNNTLTTNYISAKEGFYHSVSKNNSIMFSPEPKPNPNGNKYGTNERMRKSSKRSNTKGKKYSQVSLINNKDYKCIPGNAEESRVLTERNNNIVQSPRQPLSKRKDSDPSTEVKTIELDVMSEVTIPWLSLENIESNIKTSSELLKEAMKNYFIFIEFFK